MVVKGIVGVWSGEESERAKRKRNEHEASA